MCVQYLVSRFAQVCTVLSVYVCTILSVQYLVSRCVQVCTVLSV